jgi:hypothetical protein
MELVGWLAGWLAGAKHVLILIFDTDISLAM